MERSFLFHGVFQYRLSRKTVCYIPVSFDHRSLRLAYNAGVQPTDRTSANGGIPQQRFAIALPIRKFPEHRQGYQSEQDVQFASVIQQKADPLIEAALWDNP